MSREKWRLWSMFGFLSNPQSRLHRTENDHKSFQPLSAFLKMISKELFIVLLPWAQKQISSLFSSLLFHNQSNCYEKKQLHSFRPTCLTLIRHGTGMIATSLAHHVYHWDGYISPIILKREQLQNELEVITFVPDPGLLKVSMVPNLLSEGGRQSAH